MTLEHVNDNPILFADGLGFLKPITIQKQNNRTP